MLEKKMEDMVDQVSKFTKNQVISDPILHVPGPGLGQHVAHGTAVLAGVNPIRTPGRVRAGSLSAPGSFAAAVMKRKHDKNVDAGASGAQSSGVHSGRVGGGLQEGQGNGGGLANPGGNRDQSRQKVQRKQCYGASKVVATGRADWASPVEVFISNTSPDITEEDVKEILKLCAEDVKSQDGNDGLSEFSVKDVKCLTKPEIENPRTKCWRASVPFRYKDYILSDMAYPMGWCHRPFYPPRQKSKEENEAEQLAKRSRQTSI